MAAGIAGIRVQVAVGIPLVAECRGSYRPRAAAGGRRRAPGGGRRRATSLRPWVGQFARHLPTDGRRGMVVRQQPDATAAHRAWRAGSADCEGARSPRTNPAMTAPTDPREDPLAV